MSPIRTRAQNRRKSGVSPPPSPLALTDAPSAPTARATRSSSIRKTGRRRKSFKIEVLADVTSRVNVVEQRKARRKTSFHPDSVPLLKATPLDEVKKTSPLPSTLKRRLRMATYRASLHVHWAENLRRVAPTSPSSSASDPQRGQGEQAGGQPRSILRVPRDDWPVAAPPSNITPAGTLRSSSNALGRAPLYVLPEVPRGITLRRPWRESRASPHPRASGSQTLSVEDSLSDPISDESFAASAGQVSCATTGVPVKSIGTGRNNPALILPSRLTATRTTGAMSSGTQERATVSRPAAAASTSGSIRSNQANVRRLTTPMDKGTPPPAPPLPAEIPVVPQHHWLNLPENRIDRWIMIFYMIYAPIILPLVLRVLGLV